MALQAVDACESVSKTVYARLFDWIVARVNEQIRCDEACASFIGVLDIFGFEVFADALLAATLC